ncbi:MAG: OmpA family protein [bacterium]
MKKLGVVLTGLAIFLFAPCLSQAEEAIEKDRLGVGIQLGVNRYRGEVEEPKITPGGGAHLEYRWADSPFSLRGMINWGELKAEEGSTSFQGKIRSLDVVTKYRFAPKDVFSPYLFGGFGAVIFDPKDGFDLRKPSGDWPGTVIIPVGLGIEYRLKEALMLSIEGGYCFSTSDLFDRLIPEGSNDGYYVGRVGLTYYPPVRDRDGDGIEDRFDADPDNPEDFDGFEDEDGAPDYDNDGDGIPDDKDKCPGTDETVAKGEDTREDLDNFQDEDGCPDPDNDGDGIPDGRDGAPNEPETFNGYMDEDGVPDELPEAKKAMPIEPRKVIAPGKPSEAIVPVEPREVIVPAEPIKIITPCLEWVYFAVDRDDLSKEAEANLDKNVKILKENPDLKVMLTGHTDSDASDEYNLDLSRRRVERVAQYLINKGISAGRIKTTAYGEKEPVTSNLSETGKAKNRRVEINPVP